MKLAVLGIWRDAEKYIDRTLQCLDNLKDISDPEFYFYENDSIDNTKNILSDWILKYRGKLISENLNLPKYGSVVDVNRFVLLAKYRNKIRKILLSESDADLILLLDTDILFNVQDIEHLIKALSNQDIAMSVANTRQDIPDLMMKRTKDSFYDVLPIRDIYNNSGLYFTDCPLLMNKDRELWNNNENVPVNAAFSGVSIIRKTALKNSEWSTTGYVEHINFCYDVQKNGKIVIVPNSKPKVSLDISSLPVKDFQNSANQQKQIYEYLNQTYINSLEVS